MSEVFKEIERFKREVGVDGCWLCLANLEQARKEGKSDASLPKLLKQVKVGTTEKKGIEVLVCPRCDLSN